MKEIIDIVHKSILPFFDVCENEEEPLSDKDKLLLKVNKAICNNLKALKREPCDDAINRQAVLDINASYHGHMPNHINHQIWQEIKELPSVTPQKLCTNCQVEEKTGHWNCGDDMFEYAICSSCKHETGEAWEYAKRNFKYCPNCGAKMESEGK